MNKNILPDKLVRTAKGYSKISYEHINNRYNICEMSFQQFNTER